MHWHSDYDACLHIINKKTGEPHRMSKKIFTQGHICFHYPNAYEENGHIVIDATASWKQSNKDYTVGMKIVNKIENKKCVNFILNYFFRETSISKYDARMA